MRHASPVSYHSTVHRNVTFSRIAACLAVLVLTLTAVHAQQNPEAAVAPFNPSVYRVGERLTYNISFAQFVSAAHVEMFVAGRGRYFEREGIELRAHVETSGIINVALLALNNDYITYVDAATGLPYRSQTIVHEAGRNNEAATDHNQAAGTEAIPGKLRAGEFPGTYDLLSAVYRVRAMPLSEGVSFSINVRNDTQIYEADIKIIGRQLIKTNVGSFNTLVARVSVSSGPLSNIRVYLTEDEWHVPVLVTAKHKDGEIRAELAASHLTTPPPAATPTPQRVVPPSDGRALVPVPSPTIPASATRLNLPFNVGEELNYQVFLGPTAQPVGSASFSVEARGRYFNRDGLLLRATAQTTNAGARVFYVNDKISSYVDPETLLPFRTEMNFAEGQWRSTRGYNIDQNRGAVTTDDRKRIEIPVGTHDLISLLYAIRTFDLSPPSTSLSQPRRNAISILAINQPRTLFVTAQKRETIELNGQKVSAVLLTLTSDDGTADRLQLRLWVGDDWRHLPLRIAAVTPLGPVRADLTIKPNVPR
ncbi:MAG TPA: DUF3108 domain-containing protein [Pyrinomonadaceae bacterium]|nr:DUF3108 domain-containing protein [Pyrinomonadaceae bacterium]